MIKNTYIWILFMLLNTSVVKAQEDYKRSLEGIKSVHIELINSNVALVAGGDILVLSRGKDKVNATDLGHPKHTTGVDNTEGFGFSVERDGEVLKFKDLKPITKSPYRLSFTIPKNIAVYIESKRGNNVSVDGFTSEIEVNAYLGSIIMKNVTGPLIAYTNSGKVDIQFSKLSSKGPVLVNSTTGTIKIMLPANSKADLDLSSSFGYIHTNFDVASFGIKRDTKDNKISELKDKLNKGGIKLTLSTVIGNIFMNKSLIE